MIYRPRRRNGRWDLHRCGNMYILIPDGADDLMNIGLEVVIFVGWRIEFWRYSVVALLQRQRVRER